MPAAVITVSYGHEPGFPKEALYQDKWTAADSLICAHEDRLLLAKQLAGYVEGGIRYHPHEYESEDLPGLFVTDVHVEPIVSINQSTGYYEKAKLTVDYSTSIYEYNPDEETLVTVNVRSASSFATLGGTLYWDAEQTIPVISDETPTKLTRMIEINFTKYHESSIPSSIWSKVGKINDAAIYSAKLGVTFPARTLLFGDPSCNQTITSEGAKDWEITYSFIYNTSSEWNKFLRTATNAYAAVYNDSGNAVTPYSETSLSGLMI